MIRIIDLYDPRLALLFLKTRTDNTRLAMFSNATGEVSEISQFNYFQSQQ